MAQVDNLSITPSSVSYNTQITDITITTSTSGATIYYTTDGAVPTNQSTQYTASFTITDVGIIVVKAIGIKSGLTDSTILEKTYTSIYPTILFDHNTPSNGIINYPTLQQLELLQSNWNNSINGVSLEDKATILNNELNIQVGLGTIDLDTTLVQNYPSQLKTYINDCNCN